MNDNETRSLAHIERIVSLDPIEGADRIEVATVLGWKVVVKKGEFNVGDLACFIEIDSVVPAIPYFSFMESRKYRVRTIKMKGQISQGLIIPCIQYGEDRCQCPLLGAINPNGVPVIVSEGEDVTNYLGIIKWESQSDKESNYVPKAKKIHPWYIKWLTRYQWFRKLTGMRSKSFPDWISKTDEPRIQNCPSVLHLLKDKLIYISEKLEGQSATYWYRHRWLNPEFGICSRTVRKSLLDGSNWSKVAKNFNLKEKLKSIDKDIAIQGEIIGPGIQGNIYGLKELDFYIFNVYDIKEKRYYSIYELIDFCINLNLKFVPICSYEELFAPTINEIVELSKGTSKLKDGVLREGIVVRSDDQSISFKVINPEYLLKNEEKETINDNNK